MAAMKSSFTKHAVEVLAKIHASEAPVARWPADKPLFDYDQAALLAETDLLTEWFLPLALGRKATDEELAEHRQLWRAALAGIARAGACSCIATIMPRTCYGCRSAAAWPASA